MNLKPTRRGLAVLFLLVVAFLALITNAVHTTAQTDATSPLATQTPVECELFGASSRDCRDARLAGAQIATEARRASSGSTALLYVLAIAGAGCVVQIARPVRRR